jgi:23S rRNA (uracil1939-C5)-methyltransferase
MDPGSLVTLTTEKPVAGGWMLARHNGAIVFVAGALPGETVDARIRRTQKGSAWADVVAVHSASPDRIGEYTPCGGNVLAHAVYEAQLRLKAAIIDDAFRRVGGCPLSAVPEVVASPTTGYRMRARMHVRGGQVGFFREHSHDLCPVTETGQLSPGAEAVVEALHRQSALLEAVGVRAIELSEDRAGTDRALHIVLRPDGQVSALSALEPLPGVSGISAGCEGSPRVVLVTGTPDVTESFHEGDHHWTLTRNVRSFFQGNRFLLDPLVRHVCGHLHRGGVGDLYAGVGLFSVAATALGHVPVVAVEADPVAGRDLRSNGREWRGLLQTRVASVEDYLRGHRALAVGTVIVDPPRTGLSKQVLSALISQQVARVVYVSCDVATLARDARAWLNAGYRLAHLRAFDLFPQTAHIETVAVFDWSA